MKRRDFLRLSAGVLIACRLERLWALEAQGQEPRLNYPSDFNAYLHVGADGRVTCFVGKVELGQGNGTALAQLVADELGVPLARVEMVMGDTGRCPWDMGTFGSMSIAVFGPVLRRAAAEAREVLRKLAAKRLRVPREQVGLKGGVLFDTRRPSRTVSYGALTRGKSIERHLTVAPALLEPSAFQVMGQPVPRSDAREKVTGRARYTGDIRLAGMLYAAILRPPAHGATLGRVETSAAAAIPGARVVRDADLVAVLHEHPDGAARAAALISAEFEPHAPPLDDSTIYDHLVRAAPTGRTILASGSPEEGRRLAAHRFEQEYRTAYAAHATTETHSALATMERGTVTVWASTQAPFIVKTQVAEALGLKPDRVRVIAPYVGGGFGGKTQAPQAVEAARLARLTSRPVQVVWDRREEFFFDTFRPAAVMKLVTALDGGGKLVLWEADVYGAGEGGAAPCYDIPHQRVECYGGWQRPDPGLHPFGVGAWRAPAFTSNLFAREQQMDLMAEAAGVDPLTFRLNHVTDPRLQRVLQTAVDRSGWTPRISPSRQGFGLACGIYANTRVAMVAQVTVDPATGAVRVTRVACAQDMGVIVNPEGARAQIEGSIMMGVGSALTEEILFKDGAIAARNFDGYELPRFSSLPQLDITLIDNPTSPASAGGEPGIICVTAAIANAIADAAGGRLFDLPMTPARVTAAQHATVPAGTKG